MMGVWWLYEGVWWLYESVWRIIMGVWWLYEGVWWLYNGCLVFGGFVDFLFYERVVSYEKRFMG